jgi:hypothetical protein
MRDFEQASSWMLMQHGASAQSLDAPCETMTSFVKAKGEIVVSSTPVFELIGSFSLLK